MNSDRIRLNKELSEAHKKIEQAKDKMVKIESILDQTGDQLGEKKWTGLANKRCNQINSLLKLYEKEIRTILEEMEQNLQTLETNRQRFNREKVRAAQVIKTN